MAACDVVAIVKSYRHVTSHIKLTTWMVVNSEGAGKERAASKVALSMLKWVDE